MIDFNYEKIIIIKYTSGGGGRFLLNCLGLSDDSILLSPTLAKMQLENRLPIEKKLKYLLWALEQSRLKKSWNELNLVEYNFFGISDHDYYEMSENDIKNFEYNDIVDQCIKNNKFIFISEHFDEYIQKLLNCWKNSKFILFENEENFIKSRNNIIQGESRKKYFEQTNKLNLKSIEGLYDNPSYKWNSEWYFSKEKTISEIKKIYELFDMTGFNEKAISLYYDKWMNVIFD